MSCVSFPAVPEKLTMAMRLPPPICPSCVPRLPLRRCPGRKGKDRNPGQRRAQQVQQEHKEPIFLISPQAIFSPALPDGRVVKSSGFKWMITGFTRTSRTENRSVRKTAKAQP